MLQWINKSGKNFKKTATLGGLILVAVFCFLVAFGKPVFSQTVSQANPNAEVQQGLQVIQQPIGLPATDIRIIIANIIRVALGLVGIVLLVLIIYGGFLWMTAAGNEEQIGKAKKVLINAVIGLVIILSAYAIVLFIMRMLGVSGLGGAGGANLAPPNVQNFSGSGALGRVIKDHYPNRNQTGVPRNTKIVVTFFKPIKVDNLAQDTNGTGAVGDCKTPLNNWETDCDQLKMDPDLITISQIIPATSTSGTPKEELIRGAALMAAPSTENDVFGVYTIVIRPYDYLGSATEDVSYKVHLGNGILRDNPEANNPGIFQNNPGSKYYEWKFTCGTELDLSPPYVTDVYPAAGTEEYKNTVIQISFNEPMDPIGLQGSFITTTGQSYFSLKDGFVFASSSQSSLPIGSFNLVNNYQTLEFTPSIPCGKNACGGNVYCLPVCDNPGPCDRDNYELLLRAAVTISTSTFESYEFTGAADMCGNALDSDKDNVVDRAPTGEPVFPLQKQPDNYFWSFKIKKEMDLIPPIVAKVIPGPEAPFVKSNEDWSMWFDKRMRIDPMYSIDIQESPTPKQRCDCYTRDAQNRCVAIPSGSCVLDLISKVPFVMFSTTTPLTRTIMNHGPFLDGLAQGYIPFISSDVEDAHFNCLYPGQGPVKVDYEETGNKLSSYCAANPNDCCLQNGTQVFCCNGKAAINSSTYCANTLLMPLQTTTTIQ